LKVESKDYRPFQTPFGRPNLLILNGLNWFLETSSIKERTWNGAELAECDRPGWGSLPGRSTESAKSAMSDFVPTWFPALSSWLSQTGFDREPLAQGRYSGNTFRYRKAGLIARDTGD
jgi:hypothetical protein